MLMGDDGVGPAAIEALARREPGSDVRLHDAGLAVSDVLGALCPSDPLIVIDAVRAGGAPGSIYVLHPGDAAPAGERRSGCLSVHELNVTAALETQAIIGREFLDVTVFGVEPAVIAWGDGISPAVAASIEALVEAVLRHVDCRRAGAPSGVVGNGTGDMGP